MAPAAGGLRAIQQQVLRAFAATGRPPAAAALAETAARYGTTAGAVLAELHAADYLRLDDDGEVRAAYPFSALPTPHLVDLAGGPRVHAMCAIDALGMAAMTRAVVTITSADPRTGDPVTVTVDADGKTAAWRPPTAVVFSGRRISGGPCDGPTGAPPLPAADVSCGYLNFFTTHASAAGWASAHAEVTGQILDQAAALRLGTATFGRLLAGDC